MQKVIDFIVDNPVGVKIIWSVVAIIITVILSRLLKSIIYKTMEDSKKYYAIKQKINYIASFIILLFIIFIWMDSGANLTTYIGLLSAGIAIALKEIFTNIAGWLFISFSKPFDVGHRISIGNQKGDVIDKRLFQFSLMEVSAKEDGEQSTGRIIDVPNSYVFSYPMTNYTKGFEFIWNEIKVLLTFESDWKLAKKLLLDIANKDTAITTEKAIKQIKNATKKYLIQYSKLTPIVYTDVKDSGIQLTIRYLCEPKRRRITINKMWEDILTMVSENNNIKLAYPTMRIVE